MEMAAICNTTTKKFIALDAIADKWREVASRASSPMLDYIWARACLETLHDEIDFRLVKTESSSGLPAFAPLVKRKGRLPRLVLIGSDELFEPMDLLYSDLDSLNRLATALVETGLPIDLHPLPASSPAIEAVTRAYSRRGFVACRSQAAAPFIKIDGSRRSAEQYISAGVFRDLRRKRRRAETLGAVTTELWKPKRNEVDNLLEEAFSVERRSWKGRAGTALACDARLGNFFRRYAAAAANAGVLRISILRFSGKAVAMQINIECNGVLWQLKTGYDEYFRDCSPGHLLMFDVLRDAIERGLSTIELGTCDEFSCRWTSETREYVSVRAYPANAIGATVFAADAGQSLYNKISKLLPHKH